MMFQYLARGKRTAFRTASVGIAMLSPPAPEYHPIFMRKSAVSSMPIRFLPAILTEGDLLYGKGSHGGGGLSQNHGIRLANTDAVWI
jgi:hypothetical protein